MQPAENDLAPGPSLSPTVVRLLAGLDVGLFAGLPAIAWLLFHSWLRGEPWWAKLNVAAALFFGGSVYSMGLSRASLVGFSLMIAAYSLLGVAFSLIARPRGITRNLLLGVLVAIAWQLICQRYVLRMVDPFAPAYFPPLASLPAQLMFGIGLARFGPRFQTLATVWGPPLPAPDPESDTELDLADDSDAAPDPGADADPTTDPSPAEPLISVAELDSETALTLPETGVSSPDSQENALPPASAAEVPKRSCETDC